MSNDRNKIIESLDQSNEIKQAINKGLKYNLNNFRLIKLCNINSKPLSSI